MYQRILVPIDGSPTSEAGLDEAIALAAITGGQIRLIHVIDEMPVMQASASYGAGTGDLFEVMRESGKSLVEAARVRVQHAGIPVQTVLYESLNERVSERIVLDATTWKADLIVLGTHGRHGIGRVLMGSDAEQVARTAPVPVLLIRAIGETHPIAPVLNLAPVQSAAALLTNRNKDAA